MKTQGPKLVLSLWLSVLAGAQFGPWHEEGQPCLTCLGCYKTSRSQQESAQLWGGSGGLPGICAIRNNHTGPPCWTWPAQELPLWLFPAGSPPQHGPEEWVAEAGETLSSVHRSHREATLVTLHSKAFKNHLNYCGVQNALYQPVMRAAPRDQKPQLYQAVRKWGKLGHIVSVWLCSSRKCVKQHSIDQLWQSNYSMWSVAKVERKEGAKAL